MNDVAKPEVNLVKLIVVTLYFGFIDLSNFIVEN